MYGATNPTSLFYMALRDGGPPAVLGWAFPIRTRVKGPVGRWANWWRSIQHSPPWSHLILSTLYLLFLFIFHHRLMHRAASSSRSVADRFSSYNTRLCSETDPLTLGPLLSGKHRLYHKPMSTMCFLCTHWAVSLNKQIRKHFDYHLKPQCISIMIPDFLLYNV